MAEVFDDCPNCQDLYRVHSGFMNPDRSLSLLAEKAKEKILDNWHKQLSPYYEACKQKNPIPLFKSNVEILRKINFQQKWLEISDDPRSVQNIWKYINQLNQLATIYHSIPPGILKKVQTLVGSSIGNVLSGNGSIADINIEEIAGTIANDISEKDVECLFNNVQNLFKAVDMNDLNNNDLGIKLPENMTSPLEMIASVMNGGSRK
jgi:hypothetical protein